MAGIKTKYHSNDGMVCCACAFARSNILDATENSQNQRQKLDNLICVSYALEVNSKSANVF